MPHAAPNWARKRFGTNDAPASPDPERQRRLDKLLRDYERQRQQPLDDNLAVFDSYWYTSFSCNPRAIADKLAELAPDVRRVWVAKKAVAPSAPSDFDVVLPRTEEYFDVLARARWFVTNGNFPNHYVKRPGSVHVQTHHGTPLKKMGADQFVGPNARTDIDLDALLRRCARWDYSLSSNRWTTGIWRQAYPVDYEPLEYGYPRNDRLITATPDEVARIRRELGVGAGQTVVLYAPTHRDDPAASAPPLDLGRLSDALGDNGSLLVRLHYAYAGGAYAGGAYVDDPTLRELREARRILDVSAHESVEDLYLAADVLITDYSSAMFDYANLDRPIVVHAPDWAHYQASRGTYFDLLAEPPGLVTRTDDELVEAFQAGTVDDDRARSLRAEFRARFCDLDDGHAAERVVRRVWFGAAVEVATS
jgi:CDP-glycerol glycerophosphotransferase